MSLRFGSEFLFGYPIPEDGLSFGTVSAQNITPLLEVNGLIIGGSLSYPTLTITFKGIADPPPITREELSIENVANLTFNFRGTEYKVLNTTEGARFRVANTWRLFTWSVTGVDTEHPKFIA